MANLESQYIDQLLLKEPRDFEGSLSAKLPAHAILENIKEGPNY